MSQSLLIGLALAVGAPLKDAPAKDPPSIIGEWVGEKAVAGGKERPVPEGGITFTFTADEAGMGSGNRFVHVSSGPTFPYVEQILPLQ